MTARLDNLQVLILKALKLWRLLGLRKFRAKIWMWVAIEVPTRDNEVGKATSPL